MSGSLFLQTQKSFPQWCLVPSGWNWSGGSGGHVKSLQWWQQQTTDTFWSEQLKLPGVLYNPKKTFEVCECYWFSYNKLALHCSETFIFLKV